LMYFFSLVWHWIYIWSHLVFHNLFVLIFNLVYYVITRFLVFSYFMRSILILGYNVFFYNLEILKIILWGLNATNLRRHGILFIKFIIYFEIWILPKRLLHIKIWFRSWFTILIFLFVLIFWISFVHHIFFNLCFFLYII